MDKHVGFEWKLKLKIDLQARGARVPEDLVARHGGAGPADGITLFFEDITATVPTGGLYVENSPYSITVKGRETCDLLRDGERLRVVGVAGEPAYYSKTTADGVPYHKIALRHGRDGIGSTVTQSCAYGEEACMFCGIALSREAGATAAKKRPGDLAEVAAAAEKEGYSHIVLTTGTTSLRERGIEHLARCASAVKSRTDLKIHVQFEPPGDMGLIEKIAEVADSASINIESFDEQALSNIAPGKAATGIERYTEAWRRAVEAFGEGQVTSFVILGIGERPNSTADGCRLLCSLGVYPFLLPLRPLRGTPMESWLPPSAEEVIGTCEPCAEIVREAGLHAAECLAGCVHCGACSAFPDMTG